MRHSPPIAHNNKRENMKKETINNSQIKIISVPDGQEIDEELEYEYQQDDSDSSFNNYVNVNKATIHAESKDDNQNTIAHDQQRLTTIQQSSPRDVTTLYASVKKQNLHINGLIDTGATISLINVHLYDQLKTMPDIVKPRVSTLHYVTLADGSKGKVLGECEINIQVADKQGNMLFAIMSGHESMILGTDFMLKFKLQIHSSKQQWWLFESSIKHKMKIRKFPREKINSSICNLQPEEQTLLNKFLNEEFKKLEVVEPGLTPLITHKIEMIDSTPIKQKPYPKSEAMTKIIHDEVERLLSKGYIIPKAGNWASPPIVVPKHHGKHRLCIDYRKINANTKKSAYPLPNMLRILRSLHDAAYISTIDLSEAFHQIAMDKDSQQYTAFVVEGRGTFEWLRMPYGLTNAPSTFQELTDKMKDNLIKLIQTHKYNPNWANNVFAYIDDWVIVSQTLQDHLGLHKLVFQVIRDAKLIINRDKSHFAKSSAKFLGYVIDVEGLHPDPNQLKPIINYPRPTTRKELRRFNGMVNWHHRHLENIAKIQGPLNKLCSPKVKFIWTDEHENAFQNVKQSLLNIPVLAIPEPGLPFKLYTDASDIGLGAILVQQESNSVKEVPICYLSRPLLKAELNYNTTEKECLAVV